jgi:hypothetical protein
MERGARAVLTTLVAALLSAACGAATQAPISIHASSATNAGIVLVTQAATYSYTLAATDPSCGWQLFRFTSDSGKVDYLASSGQIYLTPGNWSSTEGVERIMGDPTSFEALDGVCPWTLTLTPS